jgi:uncharacterized protein YdhG (YjbR/CyaY superfamily)
MNTATFNNVDEYIALFTNDVQIKLQQLRQAIKDAAPDAEECISYQMPAYKQHGALVYYAVYKKHIGFYPTASGISNFIDKFEKFKSSKGAVQFPIDKPLPLALIKKIVSFKVKENDEKARGKVLKRIKFQQ